MSGRKDTRNIPASVRQKLLNKAKRDQRPFNELLQYYAMERFLFRLSQSVHTGRFILKGALMLRVWRAPEFRPTMDIDMLGKTSNEETAIISQIREIISVETAPDGLVFDPDAVQTEMITEAAEYEGIRVRFTGRLDTAKINMQIDIGFGDEVYPKPELADLPTLLDSPVPRILCYSRESAIAEKFEAMVKLRELNSRMKDFYDIWLLSRQFDFEGKKLAEAIRLTLERRGTVLPGEIAAFSDEFITAKQVQWTAFRNRLQQSGAPESFADVVQVLQTFIRPLISTASSNAPATSKWIAPGPWV